MLRKPVRNQRFPAFFPQLVLAGHDIARKRSHGDWIVTELTDWDLFFLLLLESVSNSSPIARMMYLENGVRSFPL